LKKCQKKTSKGGGNDVDAISPVDDFKKRADAYGVGVRAGAITPQPTDEKHFREMSELPEMSKEVQSAWDSDGKVRRPITLQSGVEFSSEAAQSIEDNKEGDDNG